MSFLRRHQHADDDSDTDNEQDDTIDPELRLRTVRTAASALAESVRSEQRMERRKTRRRRRNLFSLKKRPSQVTTAQTSKDSMGDTPAPTTAIPGERRNVYVNHPLTAVEVDQTGEPVARYLRNKVRTTKYTILTFVPKNLFEQFRRVANIFFLLLVILQLFPVFGAANSSIAMLPLVFILAVTAIKDAVEDYRRATQDEIVNTSAATKLGSWKNVNQPTDPRAWYEKLFGLNQPGRVTKGVKKLREKEASEAGEGMRVMLNKEGNLGGASLTAPSLRTTGSFDSFAGPTGPGGRRLDDIQSIDSHSYPPHTQFYDASSTNFSETSTQVQGAAKSHSQLNVGVVDWRKHAGGSARWERTLWKKLEVGDVVLLKENEQVPADIVVLSTSDPDGMCYLETKNLDGETNLKPRKSVKATMDIGSEEDIERSSFLLDSEPPHQNLYLYNGVLRYKDPLTGEKKQEGVTINELLLRGCMVRNTSWIIGLVVFTGADTKIMLNGGATPSKRSKIEKETNFNVAVNFIILVLMCLVAAVINGVMLGEGGHSADVFEQGAEPSSSAAINGMVVFVSCLIVFQNIVPISLYISIEIVKTIQAYFISQDVDMYYSTLDTPCVPKTWNISDDLGQIEYIFSDKTGTLTQNVMEFQKCSINGVAYGEGITEAQRGAATREGRAEAFDPEEVAGRLASLKQKMLGMMERTFKNRYLQADKLTLVSPQLAEDMADKNGVQRQHIIAFFRALAVCHTVLADKPEPKDEPYHLEYKAESPDEAALVAAARDAGFPFVNKSKDSIDIEVMGQLEQYVPLKVLEFNSTRKRMSTVVRGPDGQYILYCKGADSVIYERLSKEQDPAMKEKTSKDMEDFANSGLRTLCIAYRYLSEEEYLTWSRKYDAATSAVENRDEAIDKANELIEHSLLILGATALEDKLQEGVPDAIDLLHRAGIKLWILTGDKLQTAIEIGYSCNLLKTEMELMILSADSMEQARNQIEAGLNKIASVLGPPTWDIRKRGFTPNAKASFAVVIDGDTLRHALSDELKPLFLNLGTQCETVVCCRVSPAQKALTVKLVKEGRNAMTLSIGDGANDVAMIQEANIGCGLFGLEGSQAAMSADYAFGQFRFLTKLLLVHGRWSYQRVADMHSNFFYKNVIWTFAMFWFLPFNNFDATYLYQYTFILLCNLVFTSLPVIIMGAFDQDINAKAAMAFPQLYIRGIRGLEYTRLKFWLYMFDGLYQSAVVFFVPWAVYTLCNVVSWNGRDLQSLPDFGTTVAVAAIATANSYVGLNTNYWTVVTWIIVFGSTIVMMLWIVIYSFLPSIDFIDEVVILFGNVTFWSIILFAVIVALTPRFLVKFFSSVYSPLDKDIVREMWVMGDLKDQLGIHHRNPKKNKAAAENKLEAAPMFHEAHLRSGSEMSLHDSYEPAPTGSPGRYGMQLRSTQLDTPPIDERTQYANFSNSTGPSPDHLSPYAATAAHSQSPPLSPGQSPIRGSYYSATDLPAPSPMPEPVYRYPDGQITTTPPSRRTSVATTRTAVADPYSPPLPPSIPPPSQQSLLQSSPSRGGRQAVRNPGSYEMSVRSPPKTPPLSPSTTSGTLAPSSSSHGHGVRSLSPRNPSSPPMQPMSPPFSAQTGGHLDRSADPSDGASFATAQEFSSIEDDLGGRAYGQPSGPPSSQSHGLHPPTSFNPYAGIIEDDDLDEHERRASQISWQGGRAM